MDASSMLDPLSSAEALIQLQGKINERMMDLNLFLSRRSEVKSTMRMCEVRAYQSGQAMFEVYVDVETNRDVAVSFSFELGCEKRRWHVAAAVSRIGRDGGHVLDEYPDSSPMNLEQLETIALQASDWLVGRAKEFNFDRVP
jgi:hypothetical protein